MFSCITDRCSCLKGRFSCLTSRFCFCQWRRRRRIVISQIGELRFGDFLVFHFWGSVPCMVGQLSPSGKLVRRAIWSGNLVGEFSRAIRLVGQLGRGSSSGHLVGQFGRGIRLVGESGRVVPTIVVVHCPERPPFVGGLFVWGIQGWTCAFCRDRARPEGPLNGS